MKLITLDTKKEIKISNKIFNFKFNKVLIHQILTTYLSNKRQGSKSQKNRSEVSGSKRKPWKQKGTGRARVGSHRNPIWRSGGVTFASKPKKYYKKINKKIFKYSIKSIFSQLIREKRIFLFDKFKINKPKTKILKKKLDKYSIKNVLIILNKNNKNIYLSSRNLKEINTCNIFKINPLFLIKNHNIILTIKTIKKLENILKNEL